MWRYFAVVAIACAVYQLWKRASIEDLIAYDKCPFCFGNTLCPSVSKGRLTIGKPKSLTLWEHYDSIFTGAKNVFHGMLDRSQQIILKNLGHDWELKELDSSAEKLLHSSGAKRWHDLHTETLFSAIADQLAGNFSEPGVKLILCSQPFEDDGFHHRQVVNKLLSRISVDSDFDVRKGGLVALLHVWTVFNLNPEPIILQMFPSQGGWPVPEYLGACGRLIAEEYCGESLSAVAHNLSWSKRALLASQALNAAHRFTHGDSMFRLYLADISPDNVAVMEDGKGIHLTFVDLEDSILVEKKDLNPVGRSDWHKIHVSKAVDDCIDGSCFIFSTQDICSYHLSDHNYYAICNQLLGPTPMLPDGLLRPFPEKIQQNEYHSQLDFLIKECIKPSDLRSREVIALELQQLLDHLAFYL